MLPSKDTSNVLNQPARQRHTSIQTENVSHTCYYTPVPMMVYYKKKKLEILVMNSASHYGSTTYLFI